MSRLENDNINTKVTRLLKDLPKVNAPSSFENELLKRINQGERTSEIESWFNKILSPKLVPSAALAVTAVIILFLLKGNSSDAEDPFQVMPKMRSEEQLGNVPDKVSTDETSNQSHQEKSNKQDSNIIETLTLVNASIERISVLTSNYLPDQAVIRSGGLNYKIVRLGDEERKMIEMLREKINSTTEHQQNN
jgi:hypothetical protein